MEDKNKRASVADPFPLSLSLGIYLTIVMSLTVSYSIRMHVCRHSLSLSSQFL